MRDLVAFRAGADAQSEIGAGPHRAAAGDGRGSSAALAARRATERSTRKRGAQ